MSASQRVHTWRSACFCVVRVFQGLGEELPNQGTLCIGDLCRKGARALEKPSPPSWSLFKKMLAACYLC